METYVHKADKNGRIGCAQILENMELRSSKIDRLVDCPECMKKLQQEQAYNEPPIYSKGHEKKLPRKG